MVKIYQQPFAHAGTKQVIPDSSDPQGFVSNEDGFTTDYELPDTDPNYKPIERAEFNGLMSMVTESLGEIQQIGFAKWQPMQWPQGARVVENDVVYRALNQTSQQPPHADWVADTPDIINSTLHPSMTGSISLNGTTENAVVMADIVTELALEIGDVIRIDAGAYNKLHTVESITNNGSIIVNYEHAGNRGDGSLKLPDFTGQATVTRIAKWFNAPVGMGQAWVNMSTQREWGAIYTNTTGRTIIASAFARSGTVAQLEFSGEVDSIVISRSLIPGLSNAQTALCLYMDVPAGAQYKIILIGAGITMQNWSELR